MDEKSVRVIRNLVSRQGEPVGPATQKGAVAKVPDGPQSCPQCCGAGWKEVGSGPDRRVARCDCFFRGLFENLLESAAIPERFKHCEFSDYQTLNSSLVAAKMVVAKWAVEYPLDRSGLLLLGGSGLGKTHLSVAALKELIRKGIHCLFCDYQELLKRIQNSYNPSSQTTELELLRPVFETEVLLLDDLGATKPSDWVWDTVTFILNSRYNANRATIITANFLDGPSARAEGVHGVARATRDDTLGDRVGERMRSRLFEMCRFISMDGKDYRKRMIRTVGA